MKFTGSPHAVLLGLSVCLLFSMMVLDFKQKISVDNNSLSLAAAFQSVSLSPQNGPPASYPLYKKDPLKPWKPAMTVSLERSNSSQLEWTTVHTHNFVTTFPNPRLEDLYWWALDIARYIPKENTAYYFRNRWDYPDGRKEYTAPFRVRVPILSPINPSVVKTVNGVYLKQTKLSWVDRSPSNVGYAIGRGCSSDQSPLFIQINFVRFIGNVNTFEDTAVPPNSRFCSYILYAYTGSQTQSVLSKPLFFFVRSTDGAI